MAKLTENSYRDTNIAFANELSILCDKFDINVWELIELHHPRVNILQPGAGCLAGTVLPLITDLLFTRVVKMLK
jgi:UDP-N-acetyl-D-mannosaminuronate dehydrogenase